MNLSKNKRKSKSTNSSNNKTKCALLLKIISKQLKMHLRVKKNESPHRSETFFFFEKKIAFQVEQNKQFEQHKQVQLEIQKKHKVDEAESQKLQKAHRDEAEELQKKQEQQNQLIEKHKAQEREKLDVKFLTDNKQLEGMTDDISS